MNVNKSSSFTVFLPWIKKFDFYIEIATLERLKPLLNPVLDEENRPYVSWTFVEVLLQNSSNESKKKTGFV